MIKSLSTPHCVFLGKSDPPLWTLFFEQLKVLENILAGDPLGSATWTPGWVKPIDLYAQYGLQCSWNKGFGFMFPS